MGGNVALVTSAEYTFPIYERMLRGVLFVDAGVVRDDFNRSHGLNSETEALQRTRLSATRPNGDPNRRLRRLGRQIDFDEGDSFFSDFRIGAGFGLRIRLPQLFGPTPIALDFGFVVRDQDGDDSQVLSFSIARDF